MSCLLQAQFPAIGVFLHRSKVGCVVPLYM